MTSDIADAGFAPLLQEAAFIDGVWVGSEARIEVTNPATGAFLGSVPDVGAHGADAAVADNALANWRACAPITRADILLRWYDAILAQQEPLARLMVAQQGKPLAEALGEIAYAAAYVRWFAEEARRTYGDIIPSSQDRRLLVLREAVGVVAAVTPWNFPAAMITRKVAPALAVGCAVVLGQELIGGLSPRLGAARERYLFDRVWRRQDYPTEA